MKSSHQNRLKLTGVMLVKSLIFERVTPATKRQLAKTFSRVHLSLFLSMKADSIMTNTGVPVSMVCTIVIGARRRAAKMSDSLMPPRMATPVRVMYLETYTCACGLFHNRRFELCLFSRGFDRSTLTLYFVVDMTLDAPKIS